MPKKISFGLDARRRLLDGAKKLSRLVASTYGPMGRTVIIERFGGLLPTKDGFTVANAVELTDPVETMGCRILKEACLNVNREVGDGTTTTAILAAKILHEAHKYMVADWDMKELVHSIREASEDAIAVIDDMTMEAESPEIIESIARTSSNNDESLVDPLVEACLSVGKYGTVTIEDGHGTEVVCEIKEGMEIPKGWKSPYFVTDAETMTANLESPFVAFVNVGLQTVKDVVPILEEVSQFPQHPLIIVAPFIEGEAMATLAMNHKQKVVASCLIEAPGFTPKDKEGWMQDLAAMSGATVVDPKIGLDHKKFKSEWFGTFRRVIAGRESSTWTAYPDFSEATLDRVRQLKREADESPHEHDQDKIRERMAKLSEGFAVLRAGGFTESEMKERRARIEDALSAVRCAMEGGVCFGGGMTYFRASRRMRSGRAYHDLTAGEQVLYQTLSQPLRELLDSKGYYGNAHFHSLEEREEHVGFDLVQDRYRDFREFPYILTPADLLKNALRSAVSVATTLLTVEVSINSV